MSCHDDEEQPVIAIATANCIADSIKDNNSSELDEQQEEEEPENDEPKITYRQHSSIIFALTGPIVLSEIFQNTLPIVDLAFVGNLGKDELGAAALATVWFNLWNAAMLGFLTATDTMLAQSFGAGKYKTFAMWTGNSIVIATVAALIASGFIALCGPCLLVLGQDPDLAYQAGQFSYRLLPGLIPYYVFKVLTKYLQAQNQVSPGVYIGLLANGVNVFVNWFFIYELNMGLYGAPWATSVTRIGEFLLIVLYIRWKRSELIETLPIISMKNLEKRIIMPFIKLSISGALAFACEAWSFEVTTILAGLLGTVSLDAHVITLSVATFFYLSFPFAVGLAASLRVGQLIGEGRSGDAKRSSLVSYGISITIQLILTAILYPCSQLLGDIFSNDDEVSELVARLIPISCLFMMGDAAQATSGGVLRGLGKQSLVLKLNIVAFWLLAIPVGSLLTFVADVGVAGVWWGFVVGIYISAAIGLWILKRMDWKAQGEEAKLRISNS
jgi:MATE family multidrug resistance protein